MVADAHTEYKPEYENKIRGRVQDQNVQVSVQPMYVLTYYERPDAVRQNIYYVRELEELNDTHVFSKKLLLTNAEAALLSDQVNYHFSSINDYSRLIEINPSNPLAYFGRAVDFMLVQDFSSALDDLNRAIMTSQNFTLAYFPSGCCKSETNRISTFGGVCTEYRFSTGALEKLQRFLFVWITGSGK